MRLLITGTSGFVGGALGRYARAQGHHVTGLSRSAPRGGAVDRAVSHDLTQPLTLDGPFDAVIHAAALSSPWGRPEAFDRANRLGTAHALDVAQATGARFVLISTSSVLYTEADQFDLPEIPAPQTPPVNEYAASKRAAEALVMASDVPWVILRPRAVFGVGDTVLFPRIARAARLRLLPRFERTPPAIGDLVSIDNLVRRVLDAAAGGAGIYHLIDPEPVSITDFVTQALHQVGLPGPSVTVSDRAAHRLAGAFEAASRVTGWWEPPITHFGVNVFATSKTFDARRANARFGPPDIPTATALARFAAWWRAGARLDHPALAGVGAPA